MLLYIKYKMNQHISDNDPYSSYKKICTKLLEDYGKCILEKTNQPAYTCNDQLHLIQKWCMNPVGNVNVQAMGIAKLPHSLAYTLYSKSVLL